MEEYTGAVPSKPPRGHYINKRALKNKALAVSFDEKALKEYVGGFHKRKKKRRKEARQQSEELLRKKRIQQRKKRKLEKEYVQYGSAPPATDAETGEDNELDEGGEPIPSVSGTTMYDNGDTRVTVTTSEISREEDMHPSDVTHPTLPRSVGATGNRKRSRMLVAKKKPFKKSSKRKPQAKPQSKRDKSKGKKRNRNMREN